MLWMSMLYLANYWINLSVSYIERNSGIHTAIKVVLVGSFIWSFTVLEFSFIFYIFPNKESIVLFNSSGLPNTDPILCRRVLNFSFRVSSLLSPFSRILGKFKNLNVCPVGAVSKTMISKSIFSIVLINWPKDIASSIPGTELMIYDIRLRVPSSLPKSNILSPKDYTLTFGSIS